MYKIPTLEKKKKCGIVSMEEFSKELRETSKAQLGRKKARFGLPRIRKKLDATLQGMIGEANMKFAKGTIHK